MTSEKEQPLGIRALQVFSGPLPPKLRAIEQLYEEQWRVWAAFLRERAELLDLLWRISNAEVERVIIARLERIAPLLAKAEDEQRIAVDYAEALRTAGLFVIREGALPAWRTLAAIVEGHSGEKIDEPLPAEHTAKLRERYRARRGLG